MCAKDFTECHCSCHRSYSDQSWPIEKEFGGIIMAHVMACCSECPRCSRRIRTGMMTLHEQKCGIEVTL